MDWRRLFLFFVICFGWTWGWWGLVAVTGGLEALSYTRYLVMIGSFGPALGGIMALRLTAPGPVLAVGKVGAIVGAGLALLALSLLPPDWSDKGVDWLLDRDKNEALRQPVGLFLMVFIVGISSFVFGSIGSPNATVASYFAGLVPNKRSLVLLPIVLVTLPAILLSAHFLEALTGGNPPPPEVFEVAWQTWFPMLCITLFTVAVLTGGNEEHGWRGVLLPTLQKTMNPLLASLLIVVLWDAWHLPLHILGFYGETDPMSAFVGRLPNMALYTVFLTALYNFSRGPIFLCVVFHACINTQIPLFAGNSSPLYPSAVGLLVVVWLVGALKLYKRGSGFVPAEAGSP